MCEEGESIFKLGSCTGGIPQGSALGPLLFLVYVNDMPSQVSHSCLLQFVNDMCLICSVDSADAVAHMLQEDICVLSQWIMSSKMKLNLKKSSVMWFSIKPPLVDPPPVLHEGIPLSSVDKQRYLGVTFDNRLNWSSHVSKVCGSMSYYLNLINSYVKSLPSPHSEDVDRVLSFLTLHLCIACVGTGYQ